MAKQEQHGRHINEILQKLYYDFGPASYSSAHRLHQEAKKQLTNITLKQVKHWLSGQYAYTRHKKPRWRFPRRKVLTLRQNYLWAADLVQIDSLASYNNNYNFFIIT